MIKFIRIGDQIEEGCNQFAFYQVIFHQLLELSNVSVFNNWEQFVIHHKIASYARPESWGNKYPLSLFKSLMPPDMLPKDWYSMLSEKERDNVCHYKGRLMIENVSNCVYASTDATSCLNCEFLHKNMLPKEVKEYTLEEMQERKAYSDTNGFWGWNDDNNKPHFMCGEVELTKGIKAVRCWTYQPGTWCWEDDLGNTHTEIVKANIITPKDKPKPKPSEEIFDGVIRNNSGYYGRDHMSTSAVEREILNWLDEKFKGEK